MALLAPPPRDLNGTLADRVAVSIVGRPRSCAEHLSSGVHHNDQDFLSATGAVKSVNDKFKEQFGLECLAEVPGCGCEWNGASSSTCIA